MKVLPLVLSAALLAARAAAPDVPLHGTAHVAGKPAQNAVVWLEAKSAPSTAHEAKVVLDQRNLDFFPHVLVVRTGTTVEFPNHDRVFHNVFSFRDGKRFDLGMYPVGTSRPVTFDKPGLSRIFCNIHPNMAAYVMVVDSPFFGVSDAAGAFTLPGSPSEPTTYHAWRAGAADLSGAWTPAQPTLDIDWAQ